MLLAKDLLTRASTRGVAQRLELRQEGMKPDSHAVVDSARAMERPSPDAANELCRCLASAPASYRQFRLTGYAAVCSWDDLHRCPAPGSDPLHRGPDRGPTSSSLFLQETQNLCIAAFATCDTF
jgi:hypothetical protein